MNPLLAASLFDSPWVILAIMAASAIANLLAKRREKKKQAEEHGEIQPIEPEADTTGGFEKRLQEFLGQEPPPIVTTPPELDAPEEDWVRQVREEMARAQRQSAPPIVIPPPLLAEEAEEKVRVGQAAKRFVELSARAEHPASATDHRPGQARRKSGAAYWRNPRNARQAFVASLVFGTPKGQEN